MSISSTCDREIGRVVIDRPEFRNALSRQMWDELPEHLAKLQGQGAKVVIITGGSQCFAAGADLTELEQITSKEEALASWRSIENALNMVALFELPIIAQISGPCMGGGCLLAMACDLRYCEPSAKFAVPVAQLGIVLDARNVARMYSIMGRAHAAELLMTAAPIDAARAREIGLVNQVIAADALDTAVTATARQIAANSAQSIMNAKLMLHEAAQKVHRINDADVLASYTSADFRTRIGGILKKINQQ